LSGDLFDAIPQDDDILLTPDLQTDRTQPTLVIPNLVASEDAGVYRCKGRNVWGEVAATFPVKVHGELDPPPFYPGHILENCSLFVSLHLSKCLPEGEPGESLCGELARFPPADREPLDAREVHPSLSLSFVDPI